MFSNAFKFLAVGVSMAGLVVACGKGTAEKNKLKIDGTYQVETQTDKQVESQDESGKISSKKKSSALTIVEVKDGLRTTYRFSNDKSIVEVIKENLIIQGSKITGSELVDDQCGEDESGTIKGTLVKMKKNGTSVKLEEQTDEGTKAYNYKTLANKELMALLKNAQNCEVQRGCVAEDGSATGIIKDACKVESESSEAQNESEAEGSENTDDRDDALDEAVPAADANGVIADKPKGDAEVTKKDEVENKEATKEGTETTAKPDGAAVKDDTKKEEQKETASTGTTKLPEDQHTMGAGSLRNMRIIGK